MRSLMCMVITVGLCLACTGPIDPCAPPLAGSGPQNLAAGETCLFSDNCASDLCLPEAICADVDTASCATGSGLAHFEGCGGDAQAICAPPQAFVAGAGTAGAPCSTDADCSTLHPHTCMALVEGGRECTPRCPTQGGSAALAGFDVIPDLTGDWCRLQEDVINAVEDWGATCGAASSSQAINQGLEALETSGGGRVYLPPCTFTLDEQLKPGDHTELFGHGPATVLHRLDNGVNQFTNPGGCGALPTQIAYRSAIVNKGVYCGNQGLVLRDFTVDMSAVTSSFSSDQPVGWIGLAPAVTMNSIANSQVSRLTIVGGPQDGIFVRNHGPGVRIENNHIEGFNLLHYNGAAINVEMHGNAPAGPPGLDVPAPIEIRGNTIRSVSEVMIGSAPSPQVHGINVNWQTGTNALFPTAIIADNTLQMTNTHTAILCHPCVNSTIEGNTVHPTSDSAGAIVGTGVYRGIHAVSTSSGSIQVQNNELTGAGVPSIHPALFLGTSVVAQNNTVNAWMPECDAAAVVTFGSGLVIDGLTVDVLTLPSACPISVLPASAIKLGNDCTGNIQVDTVVDNIELVLDDDTPQLQALALRACDTTTIGTLTPLGSCTRTCDYSSANIPCDLLSCP